MKIHKAKVPGAADPGNFFGAKSKGVPGNWESEGSWRQITGLTSRETVNDYEKWKVDLRRFVVGWVNYYKLASSPKGFPFVASLVES